MTDWAASAKTMTQGLISLPLIFQLLDACTELLALRCKPLQGTRESRSRSSHVSEKLYYGRIRRGSRRRGRESIDPRAELHDDGGRRDSATKVRKPPTFNSSTSEKRLPNPLSSGD